MTGFGKTTTRAANINSWSLYPMYRFGHHCGHRKGFIFSPPCSAKLSVVVKTFTKGKVMRVFSEGTDVLGCSKWEGAVLTCICWLSGCRSEGGLVSTLWFIVQVSQATCSELTVVSWAGSVESKAGFPFYHLCMWLSNFSGLYRNESPRYSNGQWWLQLTLVRECHDITYKQAALSIGKPGIRVKDLWAAA